MIKKFSLMLLTLLIGFMLVACEKTSPNQNGNGSTNEEIAKVTINYNYSINGNLMEIALSQALLLDKHLRVLGNVAENNSSLIMVRANLWTYGAYFTAVNQLYNVSKTDVNLNRLDAAINELEWYRATNRSDEHLVYASHNGMEIPPFYDDNVWVVIGFIKAYETTKKAEYLDKAKAIMDYIYEGWQDDKIGGILWREFDFNEQTAEANKLNFERNTCINGPAAWASLLLYEITKDSNYLTWGIKIYDWTKNKLYDRSSKTYSDNISQFGSVNQKKWTYNTGTMLSAAAILYKLTKSDFYQKDVENLMEGSKSFIEPFKTVPKGEFYRVNDDNPWFRVYLLQGFLDAFRYVDYEYGERLEAVKIAMLYGYNHRDAQGFFKADWSNRVANEYKKQKTLDVCGNIENIAILAQYEAILKEVTK